MASLTDVGEIVAVSFTDTGQLVLGNSTDGGDLVMSSAGAPAPVAPLPSFSAPRRSRRLPPLHYTVDGREIPLGDPSWSSAMGGFSRASGSAPAADVAGAGQDSVLRIYTRSSTDPVWEGRLSSDPWIDNGMASIEATGYRASADKRVGRLLYSSIDYGSFQAASDPPYSRTTGGSTVPGQAEDSALVWDGSGGANSSGDLVFWAEDTPGGITRIAYDKLGGGSVTIKKFTGPDGVMTTVTTSTATTVDLAITTNPQDAVVIASSTAGTRVVNLRINGIAVGDRMTTSEIAADIGRRLGYDVSQVEASAINALPFDLQSGPWSDSGLDYLAGLDDWVWLVLGDKGTGPQLVYRPWGSRVWQAALGQGAACRLVPLERYNKVRVSYTLTSGTLQSVELTANPDPLAAHGTVNVYEHSLTDPQNDNTLATLVGMQLLAYLSQPRYRGQIEVAVCADAGGIANPSEALPGDHVRLTDFALGTALELRIYGVDARPDRVAFGIEMEPTVGSVVGLSALAALRRRTSVPGARGDSATSSSGPKPWRNPWDTGWNRRMRLPRN